MKKGEYVDEKIILLRGNCRKKSGEYNLLTDEIPVHGKRIHFRWFPLFDERFRMLLPENFEPMLEQIIKIRYISTYRPPILLSGPDYDENFGFHLLADEKGCLDELIRKMQNAVMQQAPETVVYDNGTIAPAGMDGRWFEYKNFTLDEETYNMQFLVRAGESLLAGTFNCRMLFYDEWKPLILKSLEQIEVGREGESER